MNMLPIFIWSREWYEHNETLYIVVFNAVEHNDISCEMTFLIFIHIKHIGKLIKRNQQEYLGLVLNGSLVIFHLLINTSEKQLIKFA